MNYKHLHYFWVTARSGGIVRAARQLHLTPQTLSGQIKLLEDRLGQPLLRKSGRTLELTEAGAVALRYADDIFALGAALEAALRGPRLAAHVAPLRIGITDAIPKAIAYRLIAPALDGGQAQRLVCEEGEMDELLAELAVHRLDLVLADAPLPPNVNVRAFNHRLGRSALSLYATAALRQRSALPFPACVNELPLLLPGTTSAVRTQIDRWLAENDLHPAVAGEFEDGALMTTFGGEGRGVFFAPSVSKDDLAREIGAQWLGDCSGVSQDFYAISVERRITHPGVAALTQQARGLLAPNEETPAS